MTREDRQKTSATYNDPAVAAAYAAQNVAQPAVLRHAEAFAKILSGRRVIDIGCGPGQYARVFADWGYDVVGLDASEAMIEAGRGATGAGRGRVPRFLVADMHRVAALFPDDAFDGAWLSASLLHIPEEETAAVLAGVRRIVVDDGPVYVSLKLGPQGTRLVRETKYGREIERAFTFWERERFRELVEETGYRVEQVEEATHGRTGGLTTHWGHFYLRGIKPSRA